MVAITLLGGVALEERQVFPLVFASTGFGQWIFLRERFPNLAWWVPITYLGWSIGWFVSLIFAGWLSPVLKLALVGGIAGAAQWFLLRRYFFKAGWWVAASALGWGLAWVIGRSLDLHVSTFFGLAAWFLLIGLFAGGITGLGLYFLYFHMKKA